jgi:TusA-related sulfurtransferase
MNQRNSMNAKRAERLKIISQQKGVEEQKPLVIEEAKAEEIKVEDKSKSKKTKK